MSVVLEVTNKFRWEPDEWGNADHRLFFGGIYVGLIRGPLTVLGKPPWIAWIATTEDGETLDRYATAEEARDALVWAVSAELVG
jgi:hypothetical protein